MKDHAALERRIMRIFAEDLALEVPSAETDLIEWGGLDSLTFVDLLVHLERECGAAIGPDDLDIDQFRSVARIADFVARRGPRRGVLRKEEHDGTDSAVR